MNAVTNAVWFYENYGFNAYAEFAGMYLATGAGGLYQIETGSLDATAEIPATFSTGSLAVGGPVQSRVSEVVVAGKFDGDMVVALATNGGDAVEYTLTPYKTGFDHQCRVNPGKGARGKYWQLTVSNTGGGDFAIDTISLDVAQSARRV
jgi:hypothetical protein